MARRPGLLLAGNHPEATAATAHVSADSCPGQGADQTRCLALDQRPQSATAPGENGGQILSLEMGNEGLFRTYKRTLKKVKLASRTVRLIHRELEGSLLALQILLAHADLALRPEGTIGELAVSPRKVLIEIRQGSPQRHPHRRTTTYRRRLETCRVETLSSSPKASREWPRRKAHRPPGAPISSR